MSSDTSRRDFLKKIAVTGAAVASVGGVTALAQEPKSGVTVPRRKLGRTGAEVSILGLGLGSAYTRPFGDKPEEAEEMLHRALGYGINYWDTARGYANSEVLIGPVVEKVRDQIVLVSKSGNRSYDGFKADLETSLKNLRTDYLDVYYIHMLDPASDTDLDLIENGAVKAAREAKEEGIIGGFGVTGHDVNDQIDSLQKAARRAIAQANTADF